jgi:hypothetical protein
MILKTFVTLAILELLWWMLSIILGKCKLAQWSSLALKSSVFWVWHHVVCWKSADILRNMSPPLRLGSELWLLPASCWFLACRTFQPCWWRCRVPLKLWLTFSVPDITHQEIQPSVTIAVRTSNATGLTLCNRLNWVAYLPKWQKHIELPYCHII